MNPRLAWQRGGNGYVAYPEGNEYSERVARLTPQTSLTGAWNWVVRYDGSTLSGIENGRQAASDAANQAWPRVIEVARKAAERAAWEAHELEMIAKAERGEIDPNYFANEAANYENMMWTMDQIRRRPRTAGLNRLIDALSCEFYKRRKSRQER